MTKIDRREKIRLDGQTRRQTLQTVVEYIDECIYENNVGKGSFSSSRLFELTH